MATRARATTTTTAAPDAATDIEGEAAGAPDAQQNVAAEPPAAGSDPIPEPLPLAERLAVLGLDLGSDDQVAIVMLTSMEGPNVTLSRFDPHRCDPEEAIRLVQAQFAKPA